MKTPGVFIDDGGSARAKAVLRALLAFVLFPNLLFLASGVFLFTTRSLINLDYIVLGGLWLWLPLWLRVGAFAFLFIIDAVGSTAAMYNIHVFAGVVAILDAPIGLILTVLLALALALAFALGAGYFAVKFLSDTRRRYLIAGSMLVVGLITTPLGASSSAFRFIRELRDRALSAAPETYPMPAASDSMRYDIAAGRFNGQNILMVVVESMGEIRDPDLRSFVWKPLEDPRIQQRYSVRRGDVAFRGGTTSGEIRELCGIFADYITLPVSALDRCLPRQLHARGYQSFAVHGYMPSYYDRGRWYPVLFDSISFDVAIARTTPGRRCGTQFRGICDRDAILAVERALRGGSHRFVYWMTLDAHTPIDLARMNEFREKWQTARLDQLEVCRESPEICLQALFWRDMLERLVVLASDPAHPAVRVLIVGDHAPAFVRRDRAEEYVYSRVPFAELRPRTPERRPRTP